MTYLKHTRGNHHTMYEAPAWSLIIYLMTGVALTAIKTTPKYLGTKEDIKRRRKRYWRPFL